MDFNYTTNIIINTHGCAPIEIDKFYSFLYDINTTVYDRISARKGYLEQVTIKSVRFTHDRRTGKQLHIYKSTYNWLYNESDLCTQAEAVQLVKDFYQRQEDMVNQALEELNC